MRPLRVGDAYHLTPEMIVVIGEGHHTVTYRRQDRRPVVSTMDESQLNMAWLRRGIEDGSIPPVSWWEHLSDEVPSKTPLKVGVEEFMQDGASVIGRLSNDEPILIVDPEGDPLMMLVRPKATKE